MDYRLIYIMSGLTDELRRLEQKAAQAQLEVRQYEDHIKNIIEDEVPYEDHEELIFDEHCACMAKGVRHHVYKGPIGEVRGLGKYRCVFCGCDDFSE